MPGARPRFEHEIGRSAARDTRFEQSSGYLSAGGSVIITSYRAVA